MAPLRLTRRFGPIGIALTAWDVWRRLPPRQRKQLLNVARKHGPKVAARRRWSGPLLAPATGPAEVVICLVPYTVSRDPEDGFFAQPPKKVYFRNTPPERPCEPFPKYLMFQNLNDYLRIE